MNCFETEVWDKYYESNRTLRVRITIRRSENIASFFNALFK